MLLRELVEKLNESLNREISTAIRNILELAVIIGAEKESVRNFYQRHISYKMARAQTLADLIISLFGVPIIKTDFAFPPGNIRGSVECNITAMLNRDFREEQDEAMEYAELATTALAAGLSNLASTMQQFADERSDQARKLRRILDYPAPLSEKPLRVVVNRKRVGPSIVRAERHTSNNAEAAD